MSPLRIFISSVQKELAPERAALRDYLRGDALMRKFFKVYIEQSGTGTLDMIKRCRAAGLPPPEFRQDGGIFIQTLRRPVVRKTMQVTAPTTHQVTHYVTHQVTHQVRNFLLALQQGEKTRNELMQMLELKDAVNFRQNFVKPAIEMGLVRMTQPDSLKSPTQKYRITIKGATILDNTSAPTLPPPTTQVTPEVTTDVTTDVRTDVSKLIQSISGAMSRNEIRTRMRLKSDESFRKNWLRPALNAGLIEMTIPDKPKSVKQRYRLTQKSRAWLRKTP